MKIIWALATLRFSGFNDLAGQDYVYGLMEFVEGNSNDLTTSIDVDIPVRENTVGKKCHTLIIYSDAVSKLHLM